MIRKVSYPLEWTSKGPGSNCRSGRSYEGDPGIFAPGGSPLHTLRLEGGTTRGGRSVSSGEAGVGLGGPMKVIRESSPRAVRHFTHFD